MKNLIAFLATLSLISACQEPLEPKNEFERAVFNAQRFDSDKAQDERRKPAEILAFSRVKPGMTVLDVMAGSGYYSELFSYIVGDTGKVYLHNVPEKAEREDMQEKIGQRLNNNRLSNVEAIAAPVTQFDLPQAADLIVLSKIFHDFYVPEASDERDGRINEFMQQLESNLKPSGRILLIDHSAPKGSGTELTSKTHRIDEAFVQKTFEQNGFKLVATTDLLRQSKDDRTLNIWESEVRNKTDRFVMLFEKL